MGFLEFRKVLLAVAITEMRMNVKFTFKLQLCTLQRGLAVCHQKVKETITVIDPHRSFAKESQSSNTYTVS